MRQKKLASPPSFGSVFYHCVCFCALCEQLWLISAKLNLSTPPQLYFITSRRFYIRVNL